MRMSDPVVHVIDVEPGGIVVVGQKGRLHIHTHASGKTCVSAVNCDFINPEHMTDAHRAIVEERWDTRTTDGGFLGESAQLLIPASLIKPLTATPRDAPAPSPPRPATVKRPWWKFWGDR